MDRRTDTTLADWRQRALRFESEIEKAVVGMESVVRLVTVSVFARGHVMLEGDVGVGKTTLLRAARVAAWLDERDYLVPEDIQAVFRGTTAHRVFFAPVSELRRSDLIGPLMDGILLQVAAP